jgi:hypothetical protein
MAKFAEDYLQAKLKSILPTDDEIEQLNTKDHFSQREGRYRRIYLDRIQGSKILKEEILKRAK